MMPSWDIARWLEQVTPYMLRKSVMLAWLKAIAKPVNTLKLSFLSFRDSIATAMKPNGQTMSLEWHLNNLFDPISRGIFIVSGSDLVSDTIIYNAAEALVDPFIYNNAEIPTIQSFIHNSSEYFTGNFFVVYVPTAVNDPRIAYHVNRYKLAGTSYTIQLT